MSKVISKCDCDYTLCQITDHKKHVHIDDECYHQNNFHHKIGIKFVKNRKTIKDVDFGARYQNWGI